MAIWSTKRRFVYGGSFLLVLAVVSGLIFWKAVYTAPTCTDGVKNGEEKGIDCGGACKNLCTSDTLTPVVLWTKIFNVSGNVYTAVAYVQNPNINSKNASATYEFSVYDENNRLITIKKGETSIPKGKKFAVFETGLVLKDVRPKSADFKFVTLSPWEKDTSKEPDIDLTYGTLTSTTTIPRITGTIANNSLKGLEEIELAVFVLDSNENVVAASRSFIDNLIPKSSQDFVFTWPKPFNLGVEACVNPVDIALALDRSGSMRSESIDPPEPFTTVVSTAKSFIEALKSDDQASIFSFGTNSGIESNLSKDKKAAVAAISKIFLSTTTQEQTNITGGLRDSFEELKSLRARSGAKKVIVLLTDGVPTEPTDPKIFDYPVISAQKIASEIKTAGVEVYTIGLGKGAGETFLKSISTDDAHYFSAPNKETLGEIYNKIGSSLCVRKPNVITVIYRALE